MRALDTNLLARLVLMDDPAQLAQVVALMTDNPEEQFFVPITVVLELAWVLGAKQYNMPLASRLAAIDALLSNAQLVLQHDEALEVALAMLKGSGHKDIADAIHIGLALSTGCEHVLTFDSNMQKLPQVVGL